MLYARVFILVNLYHKLKGSLKLIEPRMI